MPWVLPSVFGCTLIWFDNIYIYLFHVVCVYIYGEISAIVLSLTKRRRSLQLLRWSSVKGFSVLIAPTLPTRRVLHFTGVNWMRLSVFCESGFCLIRCWMGVLFHLLPWFPSALYCTSSMPALLSLSLGLVVMEARCYTLQAPPRLQQDTCCTTLPYLYTCVYCLASPDTFLSSTLWMKTLMNVCKPTGWKYCNWPNFCLMMMTCSV